MAAYSFSHVIESLRMSQGKPLMQRCLLMEEILRQTSTKDLKSTLPYILHEIFDFEKDENQGWQLDRLFQSHNPELFDQIRHLLSPEGPLMSVINILHADPYATYEFPVTCLPAPTRNLIEEGAVPAFYTNKLHKQQFSAPVLMLNAFELFAFHLAYALVNPVWQCRNVGWGDLYDFIYPAIVDSLLVYFLPCDKSTLPSVPYASGHVIRSPLTSASPGRPYGVSVGQGSPPSGSLAVLNRSLFKSSFIQAQKQHQQSLPVFDLAETEIWRSETLLQVLTEFWLNQNTLSGGDKINTFSSRFQEHFMPTVNHIKMVRLLVKYLHYFANSSTSNMTSSYQQTILSPLDHFKRSVIPHILQKKLYTFLRHAFDRWPLDSCFRMVLETWLSYIQPWRYTDYRSRAVWRAQHSEIEPSKEIDDKWAQFVEDNLLFYTVLTREFFPRIYRMDLTSPYSAYMVYRVSRILSLPNLADLILRAEQKLFGGPVQQRDLGGSYLSSHTMYMTSVNPSQMIDLEGPNFQYISFFSDSTKYSVIQVVTQLSDALYSVQAKLNQEMNNPKIEKRSGFFSFLYQSGREQRMLSSQEYRRLPVHLHQAIIKFCFIFSIPVPTSFFQTNPSQNSDTLNESTYLAEEEDSCPECVHTEEGWKLTDTGRKQLINREKKFDKFNVGEPDLQPVRSYENASLVRLLFHFCSFINTYFSTDFNALYERQDLTGHFARVFLIYPSSQEKIKSPISKKATQVTRPPQARISLRFLASYNTMIQLGILYLLMYFLLGVGPFGFVFLLFSFTFIYGAVLACVRSLQSRTQA